MLPQPVGVALGAAGTLGATTSASVVVVVLLVVVVVVVVVVVGHPARNTATHKTANALPAITNAATEAGSAKREPTG
jgi:hypothetical protein